MTKFQDGPAKGSVLALGRAPMFLRVVRDPDGKIDALDKLDDKPAVDEEILVYRLVKNDGHVHVCGSKNGRRWGGFYAMAEYRLWDVQPDKSTLRNPKLWPAWCEGQFAEVLKAKEAELTQQQLPPVAP